MATVKIYYEDQYVRSFKANIIKSSKDDQGRSYVVLDQTAFYPTGGGQPHDTGTLNNVRVNDVEEVDGEIRHFVDEPMEVLTECVGELDWNRRFDHMQQHAGQHILSAAFADEYGYQTVSFHLGKEICTIDLQIDNLTDEVVSKVENIANNIILENRPIETKWVTEKELSNYMLRKELSVLENIRLVIIPDFDYNGCGGTHPVETGQVSSLKVLHWEKQKKKVRVSFVCGNRVMKHLHEKHMIVHGLTSLLSVPQEQLQEATKRVIQQTKELEKTIVDLKMQLISHEANKLLNEAKVIGHYKLVQSIFQSRPVPELQQLAKRITENEGNILVLFINDDIDDKLQLVCASGKNLDKNMNQLLKDVLPKINGKGGGSDSIAQGGGDKSISAEQLMDELLRIL
ncbi:DHHA1 domain-containing protein [Ornithinibacillus salinisoli]|uniref:DHHA1 domain-containing protein n=1 Tax=Ornithinibacillus salinisoli TaxID=1848459 RepID=A0ABW4W2E5_9BACI